MKTVEVVEMRLCKSPTEISFVRETMEYPKKSLNCNIGYVMTWEEISDVTDNYARKVLRRNVYHGFVTLQSGLTARKLTCSQQ